ncbi:MAG: hypothetical protein GEU99_24460 [Luteitalea sp.]|nr:hypothetical protein [Luteitalea sp.]
MADVGVVTVVGLESPLAPGVERREDGRPILAPVPIVPIALGRFNGTPIVDPVEAPLGETRVMLLPSAPVMDDVDELVLVDDSELLVDAMMGDVTVGVVSTLPTVERDIVPGR